ncbi:MAG TPA: hypothetical protein VF506_17460 [Streptosporangiaceae bacterium]
MTRRPHAVKAMRDAAFEHCGWQPSIKLCMVLYDAAAPLIAAAERDRIIRLADEHNAVNDCEHDEHGHDPFADLLRGESA